LRAGSIAGGKRSYQRRASAAMDRREGDGTSADMDGYAARLSDAEIWNVVNYLRTLSAVSP
jgi:mono/diheme cytochrome c family protein